MDGSETNERAWGKRGQLIEAKKAENITSGLIPNLILK